MSTVSFLSAARHAKSAANEKKGQDLLLINVKQLTALTEYFLIVTGTSYPHIRAIGNSISKTLKETMDLNAIHTEGKSSDTWMVLDYGGLLIHIMTPETREIYPLEKIWERARKLK